MIDMSGRASANAPGVEADYLGRHVRRTFRRELRGYDRGEVDKHLEVVRAWFTAAGFDGLLAERREELLGSAIGEAEETLAGARRDADRTLEEARREAGETVERARREAAETLERARREAQQVVDDATRRAAAITAGSQQRLDSLKAIATAILADAEGPP